MNTALDPVWDAYESAIHALKILKKCAGAASGVALRLLVRTKFAGLSHAEILARADEAEAQLDNQAVVSLYAAFEVALRRHLIAQSKHLRTHATQPDADFADKLGALYEGQCDEARMDAVEKLFRNAVGEMVVARVGQVRTYRHWVAHGQRWKQPPATTPKYACAVLTKFLQAI